MSNHNLPLNTVVRGATLAQHLAWVRKELEPPVVTDPSVANVLQVLRDTILLATGQPLDPERPLVFDKPKRSSAMFTADDDDNGGFLPPPPGFRRR